MVLCSRSDCDDASAVEISLSTDLCAGSRARVLLWDVYSLWSTEGGREEKEEDDGAVTVVGFCFLSLSIFMKETDFASP